MNYNELYGGPSSARPSLNRAEIRHPIAGALSRPQSRYLKLQELPFNSCIPAGDTGIFRYMNNLKKRVGNLLRRDRFIWYIHRILKSVKEPFIPRSDNTMPILIFGMQRSGTTMLLIMLTKHPLVKGYSEHPGNSLFYRHRIRSPECLRDHIANTRYPFLAVKPICDSHIASDLINGLDDCRALWSLRDYRDSALSSLKKFSSPVPVIESLCRDRIEETGWFGEGIPDSDLKLIKSIYRSGKKLSPYDLSCLIWWARNRSFFHQSLQNNSKVRVISYRKMAEDSRYTLDGIASFLGLRIKPKHTGFIHSRSVGKPSYPKLNDRIEEICDELYRKLYALS